MAAGPTVLVADDQSSFRERLAGRLRERGYRVLVAYDGAQAVRLCKTELPDVAVIDVVMPNTDGLEVCRALRADERLPYIPILFLSSRDATEDKVRGLRAGADDYLGKTCDEEELLARVEALVRIARVVRPAGRAAARPAAPETADDPAKDALTGVWNDGYLGQRLASELERATRHNEPLSLMVIELADDALGDDALVAGAEAIGRCTRAMDVVTRCAPRAFAVILPNTHFAGAIATADRTWRELAATRVADAALRCSVGVACYPNQTVRSAAQLLELARSALERAHAEGAAHICLVQHQAYIFQPQ